MFQLRLLQILLIWRMICGVTTAHTVPTLIVEAEFTVQRDATIRVNLDPRLFLTEEASALPPVPASWWIDQNGESKAETVKRVIKYIDKILVFKVGATLVNGAWQISPIDSASEYPLDTNSAEVHLLATYTGPLPHADGPFTLEVSKDCTVGLILVNSLGDSNERKPQSLFGGETSVGFILPKEISVKSRPSPFLWLVVLLLPLLLLALRWRKKRPDSL